MKLSSTLSKALIITAGLSIGSAAFAEANCQAHPKNEQIPQATFEKALKNHGFTIKSFKADGNCYELYGKNKQGNKVEIYFDTKDGHIVKKEIH